MEFDSERIEHHSDDANWLMISGEGRTSDGRSWRFRVPALTTWDVNELINWLRAVTVGAIPTATSPEESADPMDRFEDEDWLTFVEPNVAFAVGVTSIPW